MTNDRYFSHDQNARHDPKIKSIQRLFPLGYKYFFCTVEYMFGQGGELEIDDFFYENLTEEIGSESAEETKEFIDKASGELIPLFYKVKRKGKDYLRSKSLDSRIDKIKAKSETASKSARARWDKPEKRQRKTFEENSIEMQIAKRIYREFAEPFGARVPNWQTWARDVDLILRRDKFEIEFVQKTLDAIGRHEGSNGFRWGDVIRCPSKLRKHLQSGNVSPKLNNSKRLSGAVKAQSGKYSNVGKDV